MNPIRRYVPVLIAGAALILAGCRDTVAPVSSEALATTLTLVGDQSFSRFVANTEGQGARTLTFSFTRAAGAVQLGEFLLQWEANSVCDPATSGYGFAYWRQACAPADSDIPMTVKLWEENGQVYADFSPDIRFSPERNVTLTVNQPRIVGRRLNSRMVARYSIYYTHRIGDTRYYVDEAWYDLEQRSHFDTTTGDVWREIRHFSGFVIRTGEEETSAVEVTAVGQ
jgi:hypothetical protein